MSYLVKKINAPVPLDADWASPLWASAETLTVGNFRPESSEHRPLVQCRLLHDDAGIYGVYQVHDRYVRSVATEFQASVCCDSCVEFFVSPPAGKGYLNFEMNCGGTLLVHHVIDPTRVPGGFKDFRKLTVEEVSEFRIFHSMPRVVEAEITEPTVWRIGFFIPFGMFVKSHGLTLPVSGQSWRANFYKCGDRTSHRHWASWQPVGELNFHRPEDFGEIVFE
ncbi:MAG: carbohydrate-binding family 9-like protein [Victivallales bacterium]|jgi:hypothetical protein